MKEVIVTGAGGFIGASLTRKLVFQGWRGHVLVREQRVLWRLEDLQQKIVVDRGVLEKPKILSRLMRSLQPRYVYHLATYGAYPSQQDVGKMIKTNIEYTNVLFKSLIDIQVKAIVVAGSSSEYGKKEKSMRESDMPEPNNFYGSTKAAQTYLSLVAAKTHSLPIVVLRLFNVYGPYEEKGRLVRSVIESVLAKKEIHLATGKEARDLVYVDDVVNAFIHASQKKVVGGEIFNIGTGRQTTIHSLAKKVIELTGISVPIILGVYPGREWDTYHWKADVTKSQRTLGWKAKYDVEKGLKKTILWYRKNL